MPPAARGTSTQAKPTLQRGFAPLQSDSASEGPLVARPDWLRPNGTVDLQELEADIREDIQELVKDVKAGAAILHAKFIVLRLCYSAAVCGAVCATFGVGLALQFFLSFWLADRMYHMHIYLAAFGTPISLVVGGLHASELWDLAWDIQRAPMLENGLRRIAAVTGRKSVSEVEGVLVLLVAVVEVVSWLPFLPLIVQLWAGGTEEVIGGGAIPAGLEFGCRWGTTGNIVIAAFLGCTQVVLKFVLYASPGGRQRYEALATSDSLDDPKMEQMLQAPVRLPSASAPRLIGWELAISTVLLLLGSTLVVNDVDAFKALLVCFGPALLLITTAVQTFLRPNAAFVGVVAAFFVLLFATVGYEVFRAHVLVVPHLHPAVFEPPPPGYTFQLVQKVHGAARYPLCDMHWGPSDAEPRLALSALDLAVFTEAIYNADIKDVVATVRQGFQGTDLAPGIELEDYAPDVMEIGRWAVFRVPAARTRVVAVRGTDTFLDAMADADLWASVKALQGASRWLPVLSVLEEENVRTLNGAFSLHRLLGERPMWAAIENVSKHAAERSAAEEWTTVLTGHSLGGGLVQIIGAHLKIPAVAWEPVGIGYSVKRFGIDLESAFRSITTIQAQYDVVPEIDTQVGFLQRVMCRDRLQNPVRCHLPPMVACELLLVCGDPRGRSGDASCNKWYPGGQWEALKEAERLNL